MTVVQEGATRVFTEPVTAGDHVTITATACAALGHRHVIGVGSSRSSKPGRTVSGSSR